MLLIVLLPAPGSTWLTTDPSDSSVLLALAHLASGFGDVAIRVKAQIIELGAHVRLVQLLKTSQAPRQLQRVTLAIAALVHDGGHKIISAICSAGGAPLIVQMLDNGNDRDCRLHAVRMITSMAVNDILIAKLILIGNGSVWSRLANMLDESSNDLQMADAALRAIKRLLGVRRPNLEYFRLISQSGLRSSIENFFVGILKRWDAEMENWERERRVTEDILSASPEEVVSRLEVYQDLATKSIDMLGDYPESATMDLQSLCRRRRAFNVEVLRMMSAQVEERGASSRSRRLALSHALDSASTSDGLGPESLPLAVRAWLLAAE